MPRMQMKTRAAKRSRNRAPRPLMIALAVAGAFAAQSARAQTTGTSAPEATGADTAQKLDRVVVTSTKREQRVRDLAGSVTVLQGGDLEARGAKDQEDLFRLTPGVQYNKLEGDTAVITIRGIGTSASANFVQSTTGVYIEDVPFNDPYIFRTSPDVSPFDLQRVEVLRGPQGVLFGSSSMGGAVRYLLNKPNTRQREFSALGSVSGTSGGGTNHSEHVMANFPLSDTTALRFVVFNRDDAGYVDNPALGLKDTNRLSQTGGRFLASYAPNSDFKVTGMLMTQTTKVDDSSNVTDLGTVSKSLASLSPRKSQFDLANVQVDYDLGPVKLTSNTGYLTKDWNGETDQSRFAAFYGPGAIATTDEKSRAFSQELRLSGNGKGPLTWLAGLFYQKYSYDQKDALQTAAFVLPSDIESKAAESSVFAQADYELSNGLAIGLGGRYFRTKNDVDSNVAFVPGQASSSESGFTPRASVKYKFNGDNMVYGLVSTGYRFGGINITQFTPNLAAPTFVTPATYGSDSLINYEVGVKLSPSDTLRLDATLFLLDWKELQLNVARPGDGFGYTANIGKARSKGLEFAGTWTPTTALKLESALALTDAKTGADYLSPSGLVPSGTVLPGTAKFQVTNQATFRFDGPFGTRGRFGITHAYVGKSYNDLYKTAQQGGYSVIDSRVAFSNDNWTLTLFATNLTNKRGVAGVQAVPGFYTDNYVNRPRTIGASLAFDL